MATDRKQLIRITWKRFRGAIRMLAKSKQGPKAAVFATTLLLLILALNVLNVVNSYVGRDFMSAIENKNPGMFTSMAMLYAVVFIVYSVKR